MLALSKVSCIVLYLVLRNTHANDAFSTLVNLFHIEVLNILRFNFIFFVMDCLIVFQFLSQTVGEEG